MTGLLMLMVGLALGATAGVWFNDQIRRALKTAGSERAAPVPAEQAQLWTCGMHPQVIQDKPGTCPICGMALEPLKTGTSSPASSAAGNAIHIDPVIVQNMGVRVAAATTGPILREIRAVGSLEEAQPNIYDINLRVSGWVEKLHAHTEGMHIRKGEPLLELYSPEVQLAIEELIAANRSRTTMAHADDSARRNAETILEAGQRKLELWGIDRTDIEQFMKMERSPRSVVIRSPVSGDVTEKMIVQGAAVKAGDRVLRIVDHSELWLDAQVYAQDQPAITLGRKVSATIEGFAGRQFEGRIIFVHPHIDPATRTARVRMALPNPDLKLRPGMFATVRITAQLAEAALQVPREAVIDTGARQLVFVARDDGHFEPRDVTLGAEGSNGAVQIIEGVRNGEQVVISGQFLIDSESRMREAIHKHLSEKLAKAPTTPAQRATAPASFGHGPWTGHVDALVGAYLAVAQPMGQKQQNDTPVDAGKVADAARRLAAQLPDPSLKPDVDRIAAAADAMAGRTLNEQRKLLAPLSDAVITVVERMPPSRAVAQGLYVVHCSMAPGNWLQTTDEVANPYYATAMKRCGEVLRRIELTEKH